MAKQTVTLRLDEDDLTYLSQVEISGAANLSEEDSYPADRGQGLNATGCTIRLRLTTLPAACSLALNATSAQPKCPSEFDPSSLTGCCPGYPKSPLSRYRPAATRLPSKPSSNARILELGLAERVFSLAESMQQLANADFPGCLERKKLASRASFAVKERS